MKANALRYGIAAAVGALIALITMSVQGIFSGPPLYEVLRILSDSFFIAGVLLACSGLILVASNGGAFDMLGYAFILIFDLFRRDISTRKYKNFYEYRKSKEGKKRSTLYLLIVGLAYVAVSACFLGAYYGVYNA